MGSLNWSLYSGEENFDVTSTILPIKLFLVSMNPYRALYRSASKTARTASVN